MAPTTSPPRTAQRGVSAYSTVTPERLNDPRAVSAAFTAASEYVRIIGDQPTMAGLVRLRKLSSPACAQCVYDAGTISSRLTTGKRVINSDGTVGWAGVQLTYGVTVSENVRITAFAVAKHTRYVDRTGRLIRDNPAGQVFQFTFVIRTVNGTSRVSALDLQT